MDEYYYLNMDNITQMKNDLRSYSLTLEDILKSKEPNSKQREATALKSLIMISKKVFDNGMQKI